MKVKTARKLSRMTDEQGKPLPFSAKAREILRLHHKVRKEQTQRYGPK